MYSAQSVGANIGRFVVSPETAQALPLLKQACGSQLPLLQLVQDGLQIAGRQVIISRCVGANTVTWALNSTRTKVGLCKNAAVDCFDAITNDGQYLRVTARVSFAFQHPTSVVRIYDKS